MYYFARSPLICLIFYITYIVFLVMTSIAFAILFYCASQTYFPTEFIQPENVTLVTTVAPDEANEMSYDDAYNFCLKKKRPLVLPLTMDEEDEAIEKIKSSAAGKCAYVFLAWQADAAIRYQYRQDIQVNKYRHPTLTVDNTTARYILDMHYSRVKFVDGKPQVQPSLGEPLDTHHYAALLFFSTHGLGEECLKQRFKCVYAVPTRGNGIGVTYEAAVKNDKKLYGLAFFDNDYPLTTGFNLVNPEPDYTTYVSYSTQYVFNYMYGDIRQSYESSRFSVIDPDYNCMAYETGTGRIVTYLCEGPACPICTDNARNSSSEG